MSSSFKIYYDNNEDFRKRHLEKLRAYQMCEVCNVAVTKSNMTRHTKSKSHQKKLEGNKPLKEEELQSIKDIEATLKTSDVQTEIKKLKKKIKSGDANKELIFALNYLQKKK
jgi:anthranilate/para-aminobenzoate synthase component I